MRIRTGMWVRSGEIVGIATEAKDGAVTIDEIADDGTTRGPTTVKADTVSQAAFADIPEARRPSRESAFALGYL